MSDTTKTHDGYRAYLTGFILAVALTAIPFGLVWTKSLPAGTLFPVVAVLAAVQMLVHFRYFLHLGLKSTPWEDRLAGGLAVILIVIMVIGTVWVINDLDLRMMTMGGM